MAKALVAFLSAPGGAQGNNTFSPIGGCSSPLDTPNNEASQRFTTRIAGTLSLLGVNANKTGTSRNVRLRKNGANGNQVVSPTDTIAGIYVDSTNSDSLSAGDNFGLGFTSSGSPTYNWGRCVFSATSNHAAFYAGSRNGSTRSTGSTTYYEGAGSNTSITTEANTKLRMRAGGAAQNLQIYIATNTLSGTTATLVSRLNGADGALTTTITNGVTGLYEDTTHSDTIASGDDYNLKLAITGGSGGVVPGVIGYAIVNSTSTTNDIFAGVDSSSGFSRSASASNTYFPIVGNIGLASTTEADQTVQHGFAATVTRLRCLVTTNTYSAGATLKSRNAGADGNLTTTITAGVTGVYEDTTHSDNVAATDNYCAAIVGGTSGSITLFWIGATEQSNDTNVAITGNAATGSPGSLAVSAASALSGNAATGAVGSLSVTASVALSGNAATGQVGSLTSSSVQSVALTGNEATGAVGTLTPSTAFSVALTGVSGTGAVGSLTSSSVQSVAITGNSATGAVGSLAPSLSLALTGNSATGSPGTLVPSAGGSIALTGVSGTGAVGDLTSSMVVSKAITGNAATGAVGSLGKTFSIALTGNAGTGSPGTLTPLTGTVVALTGVFGTGAVGDLGAYAAPVLRFIPQIQNLSQTQDQINAILAVIYGAMPGYGDALPAVTGQVDGRLFTLTTTNKLYQLQAGFWVALT